MRSVAVTRPTIVADPDTFKLPVIVWVFAVEFPKILEPELNTTEELTVVTIKVCAVIVPLIRAAEAVIAPRMF